jgi:hypothetical protein
MVAVAQKLGGLVIERAAEPFPLNPIQAGLVPMPKVKDFEQNRSLLA